MSSTDSEAYKNRLGEYINAIKSPNNVEKVRDLLLSDAHEQCQIQRHKSDFYRFITNNCLKHIDIIKMLICEFCIPIDRALIFSSHRWVDVDVLQTYLINGGTIRPKTYNGIMQNILDIDNKIDTDKAIQIISFCVDNGAVINGLTFECAIENYRLESRLFEHICGLITDQATMDHGLICSYQTGSQRNVDILLKYGADVFVFSRYLKTLPHDHFHSKLRKFMDLNNPVEVFELCNCARGNESESSNDLFLKLFDLGADPIALTIIHIESSQQDDSN